MTSSPSTALILAAGAGSRLRSGASAPKSLTGLLGLSLGERVVVALQQAGVRHVLVAVGHEGDRVAAHFEEVAARRGLAAGFVEAVGWERGNGISARAAEPAVGDAPFYLAMSDHLFDPGIARALAGDPPAAGEICLAVDRDRAGIFDPQDVTRVKLAGGRIHEIGKLLGDWDAGDTGIFLCTRGLFEGLERAQAEGQFGLSDGIRALAAEGRARAVDVTGLPWIDVDTPEALVEAERRLTRGDFSETGPRAAGE